MEAGIVNCGLLIFRNNIKRQRPSRLIFPGLKAKAWWNKQEILKYYKVDWISEFENAGEEILKEFQNLSKVNDYEIKHNEQKLHTGSWSWLSFIKAGKWQQLDKVCPFTTKLLQNVPGLMTDIPFAYSFFSNLEHEATISPHYGATNLKLRCHLPLQLKDCSVNEMGISVAGEKRKWKKNEMLIFDDTFEHETWNVYFLFNMIFSKVTKTG